MPIVNGRATAVRATAALLSIGTLEIRSLARDLDRDEADLDIATDALLELTRHETDRGWIERLLLRLIDGDADVRLRALAVTCLGHVARQHRAIDRETVLPVLRGLLDDAALGGRAQEAIDDIETFTSGA
nr:hypothetical protein GCM10020063_025130 [Dactylosporangium thailandense]